MKMARTAAAVSLGAVMAVGGLAGTAEALPGGPWASSSSPLAVDFAGWKPAGFSYGVWQGYREDQGRGSRIQDSSASRAVSGYDGGDRGAYTKHSWYWNGSYCYVNTFSNSGSGIGCTAGWHSGGSADSGSNNTASYQFWETWAGVDPNADSGRGQMKTCWNVAHAPDTCSSGSYLRGSHYG